MILLLAIVLGLIAGLIRAWLHSRQSRYFNGDKAVAIKMSYAVPDLYGTWLVIVAFLPQYVAFYLSTTSKFLTDEVASIALVSSQSLLLLFGWLNRHQVAFIILTTGLLANFIVIVSNGGLMPLSPITLEKLVSADRISTWQVGERIGQTKDRLIREDETYFAILSDRLVIPRWTGYAIAYSWGDVLIAVGTFWFLWRAGKPTTVRQ